VFVIYHLLGLPPYVYYTRRGERTNKNTERWNKIGKEELGTVLEESVILTITNPSWTEGRDCVCLYQNGDYWRDVVVIILSNENKELPLTYTKQLS
jgi:hypothetical protein